MRSDDAFRELTRLSQEMGGYDPIPVNASNYDAALRVIGYLMDLGPAVDSPDGCRLDRLVTAIEEYERTAYPFPE